MDEKRLILGIAKKVCRTNLDRMNKNIDSLSDRLSKMDDSNSSVKSRAHKRSTLSINCEERDRWQNRIEIIDQWIKEIG